MRLSSAKRSKAFSPNDRDTQIVSAVYTHRALTSDQLGVLFWGTSAANSRCRARLRQLWTHGYLERREQPALRSAGTRPFLYLLSKDGAQLLADVEAVPPGELDWRPDHNKVRWTFLDHLLATNDIRVRIERAAPKSGLQLLDWHDDATLAEAAGEDAFPMTTASGIQQMATVNPDGYLVLTQIGSPTVHRAFVEADRGTESLPRWGEKVARYLAYMHSDAFRKRYHARKPFRVLTVTTGDQRLTHLKEVTEKAGGKHWFWFTTYKAIQEPKHALFHPVWHMTGTDEPVCFPYHPAEGAVLP